MTERMTEPTTSNVTPSEASSPRRLWLMAMPLVGFVALAALFWFGLREGDPSRIPSALIGHMAPQTALPALRDGYLLHVASDAVSSRTEWNWKIGLDRMHAAGAVIWSTEMMIHEC